MPYYVGISRHRYVGKYGFLDLSLSGREQTPASVLFSSNFFAYWAGQAIHRTLFLLTVKEQRIYSFSLFTLSDDHDFMHKK